MKKKAKGNQAYAKGEYTQALDAWAGGRKTLEDADISGHHVAVFWSNEAMCCRKIADLNRCNVACQAGLRHYCSSSVRGKLEHHRAECAKAKESSKDCPSADADTHSAAAGTATVDPASHESEP